jgi:hypothetical protein
MATTDFGTVTVTGKKLENSASFSLSKFRAGVGTLVRPNLFNARLIGYTKVAGGLDGNLENIDNTFSFRCEKAELPGRTLATADDAVGGGPALKLPYDVTYNDITLSIICSADMIERTFFEEWMDRIIGRGGRSNAGLVSYYYDYAVGVSLQVDQLNEQNKILIRYTLKDIYPTALTPMNATWEETNTYQRFGVTLAYRYYTYE